MRKPRELITKLKAELADLLQQQEELGRRIEGVRAALTGYGEASKFAPSRKPEVEIDFRKEAEAIFKANGNKPMKAKEIVKKIRELYPALTKADVRSKLNYAVRPDAKTLVKSAYGLYTFFDLPPYEEPPAEPSKE